MLGGSNSPVGDCDVLLLCHVIPLCVSLLCLHMYRGGYGVAFTDRPLRTLERFEIELILILTYPLMSLGITTRRLVTLVVHSCSCV